MKAEAPAIDKGVDAEIPFRNKELTERAIAAGFGESSHSSMIELLKKGAA